ncbi:DUF4249 domain-containing protein [Thermophagus sp. OGC60D27]|uniref:DUF4249 domain-containing protein n=1 Tax=Thermophagus sp. OGC60D27 TaxID=3458415 RepID=UPI0040382380
MSLNNFIKPVLLVPAILLILSCCEKVKFDPNIEYLNENLPVVYGILANHPDYRTIELTRTAPYMDGSEYPIIEDATITVKDQQNTYPFSYIGNGIYRAPDTFKPGIDTTYLLTIQLDDQTYEAQSTMPPPVNIHSLRIQPDRWEDKDANIYEITAWLKDNEVENERFVFKYAINHHLYDSIKVWSHYTDQLTNNIWLEDVMIFGNIEADPNDTIDIFALSISESYYNFIQAAEKNRVGFNPFTPPSGIPVTGNINNGALGIFQITSVVQERVVVPENTD